MVIKFIKKKFYLYFVIVLFILTINLSNSINKAAQNFSNIENNRILHTSGTIPHSNVLWIQNPTFEEPVNPWFSNIEGDSSDVFTSTSPNQGNLIVRGEIQEKQVLLNTATQSSWKAFNKSNLVIVPNNGYGVDDEGVYCSHDWNEDSGGQPYNTPRMHWKINVNMSIDMEDYIITSASFQAIINATVNQDIDTPGDSIARWIPPSTTRTIDQYLIYDYAQFYVEISNLDVDELNTYRIAFNQTLTLGNEDTTNYFIEGLIGTKSEQAIIDALNNVLAVDPGHNNFTIVLGIYMYCEDNYSGTDRDQWEDLRFKTLNLSFTYKKKIDQFTSVSWNQELDEVSGSNVQITGAKLNFKYKIDQNWTESSQNSEILIFINERKFDPDLSLIEYDYSIDFQEASSGGFDITSKILPYENFNLSIQVFLAEDFELENNITISITDVYLYISYTETFPDIFSEPWIFTGLFIIAVFAATVLGGYLVAYQTYLKYPVPVRKVRKYRKTLSSDKTPGVGIVSQKTSFIRYYHQELKKTDKFLKGGAPMNGKITRDKLLDKKEGELSK